MSRTFYAFLCSVGNAGNISVFCVDDGAGLQNRIFQKKISPVNLPESFEL
jgi:hypothetical protein